MESVIQIVQFIYLVYYLFKLVMLSFMHKNVNLYLAIDHQRNTDLLTTLIFC